ncbi:hypothetical protein SteCoe_6947 [Stentor coeruleus]|uniref:CCDC66 domain-containing protein n=1 Tax=Stentor coeruleus TaxID=5963 RepID=A0A1R2CNU9_9CILI|nr:hypothetical protein SteCoe_6947 [Stentor coeruleus]
MSSNIFASSSQSVSRDQRWEIRRQARFNPKSSEPVSGVNRDIEIKVAPEPQVYQQQFVENKSFQMPAIVNMNSSLPPEKLQNYSLNYNTGNTETREIREIRTPPSNSFFLNPISEAEEKRKRALEMYREEAKRNPYVIEKEQREQATDREVAFEENKSEENLKKKAYAIELQQQMLNNKARKAKRNSGPGDYFPFGKPGAGAPFRDPQGNVIAVRPPKYNENDPKFSSPNNFYKKLGANIASSGLSRVQSLPPQNFQYKETNNFVYQDVPPPQPQYYSQIPPQYAPNPPQYNMSMPQFNQLPPMYNSSPQYSPHMGQHSLVSQNFYQPNPMPHYMPTYPMQNPPEYVPNQSSMLVKPPAATLEEQDYRPPINFKPEKSALPNNRNANFFPESNEDNTIEAIKKAQLGKALMEQIEERKRKNEEEKRQKILEERLEEERLARQRREIDEYEKREQMNRKKKLQDLEDFNNNNAAMIVAQPKQQRRQRTPMEQDIELPPPMPMAPQSRGGGEKYQMMQSNFTEAKPLVNENMQGRQIFVETQSKPMISEPQVNLLKQEIDAHQNELRQEIYKLRNENLAAQEQRFEAQKQLELLKEEIRQKSLVEDIRQKEVLNALMNTKPIFSDPNTKLPTYKPEPYKLPVSKSEASLSLDSFKSLPSQSKLIPLACVDNKFPTKENEDYVEKQKKALKLDTLFPSLPDSGPCNISFDPLKSANSSIGIDRLNKKNEERLNALGRIESQPTDELKKLDDMLIKYLDDNNKRKIESAKKDSKKNEYRLSSIEEEELDLSLPKSQGTDSVRLKWFKD